MALKTRWVGVDELRPAPFHADLFPLPRDLSGLRRSFARHGYRPEYPIVARAAPEAAGGFEIVCGVGRYMVARERGMLRVPVVVRRFDSDIQTRAYAIEDNLFNAGGSSRRSLAHMVVLARALKECGGECTPREIWEAAGVSPSTYWRADGSLVRSVGRALTAHPVLKGLDFLRQVAEIIREGLDPQLTRLISGDVEVNTFHRSQQGRHSRSGRGVEVRAGAAQKGELRGRGRRNIPARSTGAATDVPHAAKAQKRKKARGEDANLSLLDLLIS